MKIFEAEVHVLGTIRYKGQDFNYEVEIKDGTGYIERMYDIIILEHGISSYDEEQIENLIKEELNKKKIELV